MTAWTVLLLVAAPPLTDGLVYYLPLDGDLRPAYAFGLAKVTCDAGEYPGGKAGRALRIAPQTSAIVFPAAGNLPRAAGTVAFWHRPAWTPTDRSEAAPGGRTMFSAPRFTVMWQKKPQVMFFMTGDVVRPADGYQWDYSVAPRIAWPSGEWRHIAVTWDKATGRKQVYLDGALAAEGTTDRITGGAWDGNDTAGLALRDAPGDYDELAIWDRPLDAADVGALYGDPVGTAASLRTKAPRPEVAPWPVRFGMVVLPETATIVAPGEPKQLDIPVANPGERPVQATVTLTLRDVFGEALAVQTRQVSLGAGESSSLPSEWQTDRLGVFKVEVKLDDAHVRDVGGFAVWPDPPPAPADDSFFGTHVEQGGDYVQQAARLGQNWSRAHDLLQSTWWVRLQPEPGEFVWDVEATLRKYQAAGIHVSGEFFGTPYWAARPPGAKPDSKWAYPRGLVPDLDAFAAYVTAVVTRYQDWIHTWEIWNEPEVSMFWSGTPEEYAALCQVAAKAAKAADPSCRLFVGGFTSVDYAFHEAAAKAGAIAVADGLSFHGYASLQSPPEAVLQTVGHFRELAAKYGRADMPLWSTEAGIGDTSFYRGLDFEELPPEHLRGEPTYLQGACRAVQGAVVLLSAGVQKHFYYLQKPPGKDTAWQGTQNLEYTRVPRPKLMARRALAREVDGARHAGGFAGEHGLRVHLFERDGRAVAVVWCGDGQTTTLPVPAGATVLDLMGNPRDPTVPWVVDEVPSYVRSTGPAADLLAAWRTR